MACVVRLFQPAHVGSLVRVSSPYSVHRSEVLFIFNSRNNGKGLTWHGELPGQRKLTPVVKFAQLNDGVVPPDDDEDGVSLGTLKLPANTDLQRFESLLFQWANSLCQGANLPLPVPLKQCSLCKNKGHEPML